MSALQWTDQLLNFVAPAFFVALLLALGSRFVIPNRPATRALWVQAAINFAAGVAVLLAGLILSGHDGAMATYAALVAVCGTGQWLLAGGWKR